MKKILYTMMGVGMLFAATSCEDFLDTSSPSEADVVPEFFPCCISGSLVALPKIVKIADIKILLSASLGVKID